ncbi:MAG: DUF4054 domain-containing protein [Leptolyngbyaceae cyanobacterium MO_188.B28]|nr:DUF4054 domain-containing protein [Leptolyngbyaceae cyanobacterium MO_188.B28]
MSVTNPVTLKDFLARYPKFAKKAETDPGFANAVLEEAIARTPADVWLENTNLGIMFYVAHVFEIEWRQDSETAGNSVAIAQGKGGGKPGRNTDLNNVDFQDTRYGQQRIRLQQKLVTTTGFSV